VVVIDAKEEEGISNALIETVAIAAERSDLTRRRWET